MAISLQMVIDGGRETPIIKRKNKVTSEQALDEFLRGLGLKRNLFGLGNLVMIPEGKLCFTLWPGRESYGYWKQQLDSVLADTGAKWEVDTEVELTISWQVRVEYVLLEELCDRVSESEGACALKRA